mmetsp:Transcript_6066/g.17358  ORF Transcript_6066/g.17358 Transcript_6066/m.17358 type:complete len:270 (+) Transcript_6066:292-1101(+)
MRASCSPHTTTRCHVISSSSPFRATSHSAVVQRSSTQHSSRRQAAVSAAAAPKDAQGYIGTDGRKKATFEEAWNLSSPAADQHLPWQMSWQRNERHLKFTDETRAHLVKGFAARELGISEDEMNARLRDLVVLLPELPSRLALMKATDFSRLSRDVQQLAQRLVELKELFPKVDVAGMVIRQPEIVVARTTAQLREAAVQLQELMPWTGVCEFMVSEQPQILLDPAALKETFAEAKRIMPNWDIPKALTANPSVIFNFERRGNMIPYDN